VAITPLRADRVRFKTVAVALNPTDWKHIYKMPSPGSIIGCDYAGIVEEVGADVTSKVKKGDRIAGVAHGANQSNHADGCFAEYGEAKDGVFLHVPESLSMEEASTLGVGITTCAQGLYQSLGLPLPSEPAKTPFPILIYGGSSATGTLAIQFAKLSGLTVVTTASPHNHELLKRLGADAVFDYRDPECGAKIREYTKNELRYVFDTISLPPTFQICADALSSQAEPELRYSAILGIENFPRDDVKTAATLAYSGFGEGYEKRGKWSDPIPEHYQYQRMFWALAEKLVAEGKLKNHPIDLRTGGLEAIMEGEEDLKADRVSGKKVVYKVA